LKLFFRLYDLRHSFATRLAEAKPDPFAIAAILGHASTRVLWRCIHPTQAHQDAAMRAIDKQNEKGSSAERIQ
jgi:integrase